MEPIQDPITRWQWMRELGLPVRTGPGLEWEGLLYLCACLLVLAGWAPAVLHLYRRFPEPGAMLRFVLIAALGLGLLLQGQPFGTRQGAGLAPQLLLGATIALYAALLIVELCRRHWDDLKVLFLLPLLAIAGVAFPFVLVVVAAGLLGWWSENIWRRFHLFRSRYRLARGGRPCLFVTPQGMVQPVQPAAGERQRTRGKREVGRRRVESGRRLAAPVETEEVEGHEPTRA